MSESSYKYDIFEKLGECYCLFYLIYGIFTIYCWSCKELDFVSDSVAILLFWNPVCWVFASLNFINFVAMTVSYYLNKKNPLAFIYLDNESNILFYFLCIPLFIISFIYNILELIWQIESLSKANIDVGYSSIFSSVIELLIFCFVVMLIIDQNRFMINRDFISVLVWNKFVNLISIMSMLQFFIYHMASQQIHNFITVASNYTNYSDYFSHQLVENRTNSFMYHQSVRDYVQPLVILFCCSTLAYLTTIFYRNSSDLFKLDLTISSVRPVIRENVVITSEICSYQSTSQQDIELNHSVMDTPLNNKVQINNDQNIPHKIFPSFRLPPMSLVLGILFITLSILILVIVDSFLSGDSFVLKVQGVLTFSYFPVPVYVLSLVLLVMQIHEMKRWEKLKSPLNIVDKTLVWIGAAGQLIVALSQIKYYANCKQMSGTVPTAIYIEYGCLIVQCLLQTIVLGLALERQWIVPVLRSLQEYICPSVGLLSINIAFFFFSLYSITGAYNDIFIGCDNSLDSKNKLYLRIFGHGFHTMGETLALLHRMHCSLLFGRIVIYTNTS